MRHGVSVNDNKQFYNPDLAQHMNLQETITYLRNMRSEYVQRFSEALAIPSISTFGENRPDMLRMAAWLEAQMSGMGLENIRLMSTTSNPIVYGDWLHAPGKPTVLVYGHYDVQPADPLDEWESSPFSPTLRGDYIYARGASDMKGQIFAQLMAVEALMKVQGSLPVNLKYLIEGDEEVGSPPLQDFLKANKDLLRCDAVLNCDSMLHGEDTPSIVYALRGLAYFEVEITGPARDLHSGVFGGIVRNPLDALCCVLAGMHDRDGRITLPGFYDTVRPLSKEERGILEEGPYTDEYFLNLSGAPGLCGESGYSTIERLGARPSLDINGIWGGFQGEGAKTVLPARAGAKLSMRLVADQELEAVVEQLRAYLQASVPAECRWTMTVHSLGPGAIMDRNSACMRAAAAALKKVFGKEPFFRREGASVPVVGMMQQVLGVDSVMLGFGLPEDGIHGPNERQSLPLLFKGMETYLHFMEMLASG